MDALYERQPSTKNKIRLITILLLIIRHALAKLHNS